MNSGIIPWLWSFVMPAVVVQWALLEVIARAKPSWKGARLFVATAGLALAIMCCPAGDRSLARQIAGFSIPCSLPLLALVCSRSSQRCFGRAWFRCEEQRLIWWFGFAAGLWLYPCALGWTGFDSYGDGWPGHSLFWLMAMASALAIGNGNRLGWILLVSIGAWHVSLLESRNYWDYVVDPFFFLGAGGAIGRDLVSGVRRLSAS